MQLALTLQYLPPDGVTPPIAICTSAEPTLLREYCSSVLSHHERRCEDAGDPVERLIAESEATRLRDLLDALIPEGVGQ